MLPQSWRKIKKGKEKEKGLLGGDSAKINDTHEDIDDVLARFDNPFTWNPENSYTAANPKPQFEIGMEDSIKPLYEGPEKCKCCINWVEEYPDNLKEELLGTLDVQKYAIVTKNMRNHKGNKPIALHSIDVQSPLLKKVLESVFEGYSGITPGLEVLTFSAPFHAFFHRLDRLEEASKHQEDPKALAHTKLLYDIVHKELQEPVKTFNDLVANRVMTFEYLWALFTPGDLIKSGDDGLYRLESAKHSRSATGSINGFTVTAEFIDWDGTQFGYDSSSIFISPFDGTKQITEMEAYPAIFDPDLDRLKARLLGRGKKFESLEGFHYMAHKGLIVETASGNWLFGGGARNVEGRVIIDAELFFRSNPYEQKTLKSLEEQKKAPDLPGVTTNTAHQTTSDYTYHAPADGDNFTRTPRQAIEHLEDTYQSGYEEDGLWIPGPRPLAGSAMTRANSAEAGRQLTEDELILCSHIVRGFSLKTKHWASFEVDDISEIKWDEHAFESLVLPSNYKQLILSFVEGQMHYKDDFDDVIEGKGQGIIILLAGVPGVGKTLTAESVAENLRAPLYYMTAGELSLDASSLEQSLSDILERCTKWNAVLLLDEADVFLEQRSSTHLERNKLVSIFLRLLEYYRGMLFLTTNRLSAFDSAFQSRIHITIHYPPLSSAARSQIWRNFLQMKPKSDATSTPNAKLSNTTELKERSTTQTQSSPSVQAEKQAPLRTSVSDLEILELADIDLNGRQIKNVVKTSRLLARRLGKSLSIDELKTVLEVMHAGTFSRKETGVEIRTIT